MKYIFIAVLATFWCTSTAQSNIRKEINYIVSSRGETDSIIVEVGHNPRLYTLHRKNNTEFHQYATLLKEEDFNLYSRLFEIGIDEQTYYIKSLRPLDEEEEDKYRHLKPYAAFEVAAVAVNDDAEKLFDSALVLFNGENYKATIAIINKAIAINTQKPDYHNLKALCLGNMGRYQQSTDEAMYALEMDPANPELFEIIATNYYFLKDNENATKNFEKAIEYDLSPYITRIYHNYVRHLIEVPDPQRAVEVYKLCLYRTEDVTANTSGGENLPDDLNFYGGQAYQQLGDWKNAIRIYNRLIVINPDFSGYYAQRGWLNQQRSDWSAAISDYEMAIELDTAQSVLLTNLAEIYHKLKEYKKADAAYLKYLTLNPDDTVQSGNYAYLLLDAERYKDAQAIFERLLKADDTSIDVHVGLILSCHLLGENKKKDIFIKRAQLKFAEIPITTATLDILIKTGKYYYSDKVITVWKGATK